MRGLLVLSTPPKGLLSEARVLAYWMLFPMVVMAIDTPEKLRRFTIGMLVAGLWLAIAIVLSSLTGLKLFEGGALQELQTVGDKETGFFRSQPGGMYMVVFAVLLVLAKYASKGWNLLPVVIAAGILCVGIVLNFGRGIWAATAVGLVVLALLFGVRRWLRIGVAFAVLFTLAMGALHLVRPQVIPAAVNRVLSVDDEIAVGSSFDWRRMENSYATAALMRSPVFGIGLGVPYRPTLQGGGDFKEMARYIHNSFFALMLKLGPLAALFPFFAAAAFFIKARSVWRLPLRPDHRAILGAAIAVFGLPAFVTAFTQPEWVSTGNISLMATMMALLVVIARFNTTAPAISAPPRRLYQSFAVS